MRAWPAGSASPGQGEPLPDGLAEIDIDAVRAAQHAVREGVRSGSLTSAHDIAEGGLAVALAECCLAGEIGAEIELRLEEPAAGSPDAALFGEGPGGFVVSGSSEALSALGEQIAVQRLGTVGGDALTLA